MTFPLSGYSTEVFCFGMGFFWSSISVTTGFCDLCFCYLCHLVLNLGTFSACSKLLAFVWMLLPAPYVWASSSGTWFYHLLFWSVKALAWFHCKRSQISRLPEPHRIMSIFHFIGRLKQEGIAKLWRIWKEQHIAARGFKNTFWRFLMPYWIRDHPILKKSCTSIF